jgi:hypothetical protein
MRRAAAVLFGLAVAPMVLVACGGGGGSGSGSNGGSSGTTTVATTPATTVATRRQSAFDPILEAVCQAASEAGTDPAGAGRTFYARAHEGLHALAGELAKVDRIQAATVLEAKEKVEADLAATPPGSGLAQDLSTLAVATGAGVNRLAPGAPTCNP